jgi:hypothetical protein
MSGPRLRLRLAFRVSTVESSTADGPVSGAVPAEPCRFGLSRAVVERGTAGWMDQAVFVGTGFSFHEMVNQATTSTRYSLAACHDS